MKRFIFFVAVSAAVFCFSSVSQGNDWETLPVFSGGRVMPLHTFAQHTVKEICGTTRPFVVRDNVVLDELSRVIQLFREREREQTNILGGGVASDNLAGEAYRFLIRGSDLDGGFGKGYSLFDVERETPPISSTLPIKGLTRVRAEHLSNRIRLLVPTNGRYFTADELLLSWSGEPEVWMFIPIFPVTDLDFGDDVLEMDLSSDRRSTQHRVSLYQLTKSPRYQQRLADIDRRRQLGQITEAPIRYDQIAQHLEEQSRQFRELTFHPRRSKPLRMIRILEQAGGLTNEGQASYSTAFDAWRYLLTIGEVPARQSTEPKDPENEDDALRTLHPTTKRWHDIADKLHLLIRVFNRTDSHGNMVPPNTDAVERQFEQLIALLDTNLNESEALMSSLYPGVSFRNKNQPANAEVSIDSLLPLLKNSNNERSRSMMLRLVPGYYYAVKRLRYETEAAYLALYDDGQALRILPVCSLLSCGGIDEGRETFGVQPWGSFQMITTAGEAFVKRFFDPQFQAPAAQKQAEKKPVDTDLIHISTAPRAAGANETDAGKPQGTDIKDELESAAVSNNPLDAINESVRVLSTTKPDKEDEKKESADEEQPADGETPEDKDGKPLTEAEKKQKAAEKKLQDEMFAKPASEEELIFEEETTAQQHSGFINAVRTDFGMLLSTYVTQGVEYGDTQFSPRASSLKNVIQAAAAKIEPSREQIADIQDPIVTDLLKKTAYPVTNVLVREYNYTRFEPFYWMFIFGAAAAVLGLCAFFCGSVRRDMIGIPSYSVYLTADSIRDAEQRPDYTNTFEEFLNTAAAAMLLLSVLITFIGGAMRASITGWAPVTNMYETIVFTAFCAGLFGLWYSLYPLLQPVLQIGWHYARFPSLYLMIKLLTEKKTDVTARGENETEGEFAMRQAAADFGVMHHDTPHRIQDEQESEKTRQESLAKVRLIWQGSLMPFRLVLMYAVFYGIVMLCSGHYAAEHGLWAAAQNMLAVNDVIDMLVIVICWSAAVWYLPRFILMFVPVPFMLLQPRIIASELGIVSYKTDTPAAATASGVYASAPDIHPLSDVRHSEFSSVFAGEHIQQTAAAASTDNSGSVWFTMARNGILERKLFIVIAAAVLVLAGLAAYLNSAEFNPEIRPIAAVLRSNFWLTVHVIAIVASYAAAFVAWGISIAALGSVVFGKFQRTAADLPNGKVRVQLPVMSRQCSPIINKLLKLSLLLLIIGTVLGARWADYSWGRFWSWDPKEVWALITIMFYVMVLHGVIARWYGQIGVMVGALFASIAVIITWYGINFVFKGSMHSYGSGSADNAKLFLGIFIVANLLWGTLAILRYTAETYSSERDNQN